MMNVIAVIDAGVDLAGLEDLTLYRTEASIPFAGRYRLVDFALSNLVNSEVNAIGIFPSQPLGSLLDHIGKGKSWDLDRKKDGLFFLPPMEQTRSRYSVGNFVAIGEHKDFFERSSQTHVAVTNCFTISQLDYSDMFASHIRSGADITEAVKEGRKLRTYLLSKELLLKLLRDFKEKKVLSVEDLVRMKKPEYHYSEYEYTGYVAVIDSVQSYFDESMALLDEQRWWTLFLPERPIMTKVKDEPPTQYLATSEVTESFLANGSTIAGTVSCSIIGRAVKIGIGSHLEHCIIMQQCDIAESCRLSYVIADKDVKIGPGVELHGTAEHPIVLRKGQHITKEEKR